MCGNRRVLFNNKTQDEAEKSKQLEQLHALLNTVAHNNGGKPYTRMVVDTNEGKPYKHDAVVGTTGGKPYTHGTAVGTIVGKKFTKNSKPKKEGSTAQYDRATNKPHARTAEVSSSKKEDDIFELHVRKAYEAQLENARLKGEIDILRDQMESNSQKHKLQLEIEIAKKMEKDKNLIFQYISHFFRKFKRSPPSP